MGTIPDTAIGAVVAALIAGTISLLGLIISKEQKTSEFRQAWIDALRSDLTLYLTQMNAIHDAVQVKYSSVEEKLKALSPLFIPLNMSTFNILLRINPDEALPKRIRSAMEAFNAITFDVKQLTTENLRRTEAEFLTAAQALLKSEWQRVKSGEPAFKSAKVVALLVVVASAAIGVTAAYKSWRFDVPTTSLNPTVVK